MKNIYIILHNLLPEFVTWVYDLKCKLPAIILNTKNLEINYKFKHILCSFMQGNKILYILWNNLLSHSWIKCIWCFYTIVVIKLKNHCHSKTCIFALLFLWTIINILIQVIVPNIITYLDKAFKEEQNDIHFKTK